MSAATAQSPAEARSPVLPTEGATAVLLRDLLGTPTSVKQVPARLPMGPRIAVGTYVSEGRLAGLMLCDIEFAAATGAALAMFPPATTLDAIKRGRLEDALEENWREVANIFASTMNAAGGVHVKFDRHFVPGAKLPPEISLAITRPFARVDFEVAVGNLPKAKLSLLVLDIAQP